MVSRLTSSFSSSPTLADDLEEEVVLNDLTKDKRSSARPFNCDVAGRPQHLHTAQARSSGNLEKTPSIISACFALHASCLAYISNVLTSTLPFLAAAVYMNVFLVRLPSLYELHLAKSLTTVRLARGSSSGDYAAGSAAEAAVDAEWVAFLKSLAKDWRLMTGASSLLFGTIIAVLQVSSIAEESVTMTIGLITIISSFNACFLSCVYQCHVNNIRTREAAFYWEEGAVRLQDSRFLNAAILLSIPAAWLTWSFLLFITFMCSYIWRPVTHNSGNNSSGVGSGITSLPLPSRVVLISVLLLAMMHSAVNIVYFTGLGYRLGNETQTAKPVDAHPTDVGQDLSLDASSAAVETHGHVATDMAEDIDADAVPMVNLALQASVSVDESWMSDSADADASALAAVHH